MFSSQSERLPSTSLDGMTVTPIVRVRSFRWRSRWFAFGWSRATPMSIEVKREGTMTPEIVDVGGWLRRPTATLTLGAITLLAMTVIRATRRST